MFGLFPERHGSLSGALLTCPLTSSSNLSLENSPGQRRYRTNLPEKSVSLCPLLSYQHWGLTCMSQSVKALVSPGRQLHPESYERQENSERLQGYTKLD